MHTGIQRCLRSHKKMKQLGSVYTFLTWFREQGDDFPPWGVQSLETSLGRYSHLPELKQQSIKWRHTSSTTKKFKHTYSFRKSNSQSFGTERSFAYGVMIITMPVHTLLLHCNISSQPSDGNNLITHCRPHSKGLSPFPITQILSWWVVIPWRQ